MRAYCGIISGNNINLILAGSILIFQVRGDTHNKAQIAGHLRFIYRNFNLVVV